VSDELENAASLLRELFAGIDQLCECQGNKAKLEVMSMVCDTFLDLQDIVKANRLSVVVANGEFEDTIIAQA
jgi:hypothetical protein